MKRRLMIVMMAGSLSFLAACSPQKNTASNAGAGEKSLAVTMADTPADTPTVTTADTAAESPTAQEQSSEEAYHKITAEEAKKMMDEGGVIIVDVRTSEEYREAHIPDSILVPNESITTDQEPEELPDKDAVLLVHCRTGIRSKQASDKLVELGYKHVYDFGGIVDWPYETVSEVVGST